MAFPKRHSEWMKGKVKEGFTPLNTGGKKTKKRAKSTSKNFDPFYHKFGQDD